MSINTLLQVERFQQRRGGQVQTVILSVIQVIRQQLEVLHKILQTLHGTVPAKRAILT